MTENPYRSQPDKAFWSRSVANQFDVLDLAEFDHDLIRRGETFASAGSCFAANVIEPLENAGFAYVRTEELPPPLCHLPENLGYAKFSARYGNIYTARQFRQLIERAAGEFDPQESFWDTTDSIIDPFRPGLRYPARTMAEFAELQEFHLDAVRRAFTTANVTIFTLGLTEAWESVLDGAVFPTCPGTVGGEFDPARHSFRNFTVDEVVQDMQRAFEVIRIWNPSARFILTVSPVPLVATATKSHVLSATTLSKSILRVAAGILAEEDGIDYFPAYEIVTGPQAPHNYFESNRRDVAPDAIKAVMRALLSACQTSGAGCIEKTSTERSHVLSRDLITAECDEVVLEW
jgi:hypothetical protein